ncbi:MAG: hypothetical protein ACHQXA_02485 [Gemmatimonadales bacterium]
MRSTLLTSFGAVLVIAAIGASPAAAQASCSANNCTLTQTVSATIPDLMKMTLSANTFTLTAPIITDFGVDSTAHITEASTFTVAVQSNRKYNVTVASPVNFTAPAGVTKPASDLSYNVNAGAFVAMSNTAANLYAATQNTTFGRSALIGLKTDWHFVNDASGGYSLVLTYTLVGQ